MKRASIPAVISLALLTACGGSSDDDTNSSNPPPGAAAPITSGLTLVVGREGRGFLARERRAVELLARLAAPTDP
mgnify:CR=1 FL=1